MSGRWKDETKPIPAVSSTYPLECVIATAGKRRNSCDVTGRGENNTYTMEKLVLRARRCNEKIRDCVMVGQCPALARRFILTNLDSHLPRKTQEKASHGESRPPRAALGRSHQVQGSFLHNDTSISRGGQDVYLQERLR